MRPILFFLFANLAIAHLSFAQPVIMYPGDANNDGKADHYDLLPIGIAYGKTGPPRVPASLNWVPQLAQPWAPQVLPVSQIDLGHVDCDGNGKIDSLDIQAVALNYDETQSNSVPPPIPYIERLTQSCFSCPPPDIIVTFDKKTVSGRDTFSATFMLHYPPNVPPFLGALGIAFDVEYDYDPDKIVDSLTKVFPFDDFDDRMYVVATHTEVVTAGLLPPAGKIGFAAAGKGQNVYFAPTPLFTAEFIIEDMIVRKGDAPALFTLKISNVLILNEKEQIILPGKVVVDTVVVAAKEPLSKKDLVRLSPNPVREMLTLDSPESPIERVEIRSIAGERVFSVEVGGQNKFELPVASLSSGVWLAVVQTKKGASVKKFVKME